MFCKNSHEQISLFDTVANLPNYLKIILEKSWAQNFRDNVFPNINEELFAVLYSDNPASRPNSPVNVIVGLLIIKELFSLIDEDLIGSLHFDDRFKYALCTTSYEKQPVSINTLSNFRKRLYSHLQNTGEDLIQIQMEELAKKAIELLDIDLKRVRMDSLMVSSSCAKLSRIELVYSVNYRFVKALKKAGRDDLIGKGLESYLKKGNKNDTIYRAKSKDSQSKLQLLINDANELYKTCYLDDECRNLKEFKILTRMLNDQVIETEEGEFIPIEGKDIASTSLQNPTDPDATYREKYGDNIGYVANVAQVADDEHQLILNYDFEQNIVSDIELGKKAIEKLSEIGSEEEPLKIGVDGAFYSEEVSELAKEINVEVIPSQMLGRIPDEEKIGICKFNIDEEDKTVNSCPNGFTPSEVSYNANNDTYTAKMEKQTCANCPMNNVCPIKHQKKMNVIKITTKQYHNSQMREKLGTKEFKEMANFRAGVEGVPSVLRRKYKIDTLPIKGLVRSKIWFGFKIMAYNFKSLVKGLDFLPKFIFLLIYSTKTDTKCSKGLFDLKNYSSRCFSKKVVFVF